MQPYSVEAVLNGNSTDAGQLNKTIPSAFREPACQFIAPKPYEMPKTTSIELLNVVLSEFTGA